MTTDQRESSYALQAMERAGTCGYTGAWAPTPRQQRRIRHKRNRALRNDGRSSTSQPPSSSSSLAAALIHAAAR